MSETLVRALQCMSDTLEERPICHGVVASVKQTRQDDRYHSIIEGAPLGEEGYCTLTCNISSCQTGADVMHQSGVQRWQHGLEWAFPRLVGEST